ncbi:MAG TPA: hypothetical protein DG577_04710 [Firmicutes bacterium]|nr:hypothetical protein [Bacillota bacterium]
MKSITRPMPIKPAQRLFSSESLPKVGPTVRTSSWTISRGRAPERSKLASRAASSMLPIPVITALPSVIAVRTWGAEITSPSR